MASSVTIAEVAKRAGVSPGTVSHVLNGNQAARIAAATQERVRRAAEELGYRPNLAARALLQGRTRMLSLIVPSFGTPFHANVIDLLWRMTQQDGYRLIVAHDVAASSGKETVEWPGDGAIIVDIARDLSAASPLVRRDPTVCIGSDYAETGDYVGVDLFLGTQMAVRHLAAQGRRRIAYLAPWGLTHPGNARHDGYFSVIEEAGLEPLWIEADARGSARLAVSDALHRGQTFDAMFCYSDDMAIGAFRALHDHGLRLPEDVALIGCDGLADLEYFEPAISTVVQPVEEMCWIAWSFLQRRMETPGLPPQRQILEPTLRLRPSSERA